MAYKFQLGNAVLSGSLTQKEGLNAGDDGLSNAGAIAGATTVTATGLGDFGSLTINNTSTIGCDADSDLITLDNQEISFADDVNVIIGKAGGLNLNDGPVTSTAAELNFNDGATAGTAVASKTVVLDTNRDISGLRNVGATQLSASANVLVGGDITGSGGITVADASGILRGNGGLVDTGNGIQLNSTVAGDGLAHAAGVLSINVDDSSIETSSDALQVKAGGITNDMLAGSIVASKMNGAIFADLETLGAASSDGEFIVATGAGAFAYESGNTARTSLGLGTGDSPTFATGSFTGDLTVSGDLTVQGDVVAIEATTLRVVDKLIEIASGSADDATLDGGGIQFNSGDGNKTLTFQATGDNLASSEHFNIANTKVYKINNAEVLSADGAAKVQSAVAGTGLGHSAGVLSIDIPNTDDIGAAIASTDEFLISDGGTLKRSDMSRVATFIGDSLAVNVQNVDDSGTLQVGVNFFGNHGGAESVTLPASPSVGQSVKVKAGSDCSSTNKVTINRAGSQTIDGVQSIILESPFAAVELVYVDDTSKLWRVF